MKEENEYYNYIAFYRGIPVYIGKGKGGRSKHTQWGASGSREVNEFYFRSKLLGDMPLDTYIVKKFSTENSAYKNEAKLIKKYLPYCNKSAKFDYTDEYSFRDKLCEVAKIKGFNNPEILISTLDFRFLFTPKGLLCKKVELSSNSPFEYTGEKNHIRIKKSLYEEFPEFGLQFCDYNVDCTIEYFMTNTKQKIIRDLEKGRDLYKDVSSCRKWAIKTLELGSFDFITEFGYKKVEINYPNLSHFSTIQESHIYVYEKHMQDIKKKDRKSMQQERRAKGLAESLVNKGLALSKDEDSYVINNAKRVEGIIKERKFKFKASDKSNAALQKLGSTFSSKGGWVNLVKGNPPKESFCSYKEYKTIKPEELFLLNLSEYGLLVTTEKGD